MTSALKNVRAEECIHLSQNNWNIPASRNISPPVGSVFLLAQIYSGFTPHCQFPVRIIIERVSADVYQDHHRFTLNILSKSNLTFLMLLLHYFHSDLLKINIEPFVYVIAQPIYIKASLANLCHSFFLTYFRSTLTSTHTSGRYYLVCTQF